MVASCNFVLCLTNSLDVATAVFKSLTVCNLVSDSIFCTILVTELLVSSMKLIWSPIFNSVVNLVPEPTKTSDGQ